MLEISKILPLWVSANDHKRAVVVVVLDLGVINDFDWVGEFQNSKDRNY